LKIKYFTFLFLLFFYSTYAQEKRAQRSDSRIDLSAEISADKNNPSVLYELIQKRHFDFHFYDKSIDTLEYYKAAYYFNRFNNYRFYNKRRVINFSNKKVSIELYSVKELEEMYNKKVQQYLSEDKKNYPEIEFIFYNGNLKELLIN